MPSNRPGRSHARKIRRGPARSNAGPSVACGGDTPRTRLASRFVADDAGPSWISPSLSMSEARATCRCLRPRRSRTRAAAPRSRRPPPHRTPLRCRPQFDRDRRPTGWLRVRHPISSRSPAGTTTNGPRPMTDSNRFETRLIEALARYAGRASVDVDPERLVGALATMSTAPRTRRTAIGRPRLALAIVLIVAASLAGIALFGGRLIAPRPPIVPTSSPSASSGTPTTSPSPVVTTSPTAIHVASLDWAEQDIGTQPAVTSIWRVGEWFIAVGPAGSFAGDDRHADARFIRSRDGNAWESVPAPARGLEAETGTVDGGKLWLVGSLGTSAEPKRGIWTTSDGVTWQRVADVTGLDFGPGGVTAISAPGRVGSHSPAAGSMRSRRTVSCSGRPKASRGLGCHIPMGSVPPTSPVSPRMGSDG